MVSKDNTGGTSRHKVIIVAAGSGNRFGGDIPKQFALLKGRPVLMRTVDVFREYLPDADIIVVLSPSEMSRWASMCAEYGFESPRIVAGGASRTESVRNALAAIADCAGSADTLVFIHDGARPLLTAALLHRETEAFADSSVEALIPYTPLTDSLMTNCPDNAVSVDRSRFVAVQTPQVFRASTIISAYNAMPAESTLSDDASVVSKYAGAAIHLVEGEERNIKITYPLDQKIAGLYLDE